ncbi:hypothetical protein LJR189_004763 [Acidovorax delafieldii]|uniref:hypothetical protein n=1 Tax=Acidovorax delafieldii TaxID=47920 RepID=UPI003ECC4C6A
MQRRKQGLLDKFAVLYLLASVALALGLLGAAFAKGVDLMGAPYWAWTFWSISLLVAINIAYFIGERRHTKAILGLGVLPLLLFVLSGALETLSGAHEMMDAFLLDLYTAGWFVALVICPAMLLVTACAGWYGRRRSPDTAGG